jgi:hypothetical protein
MQEKVNYLRESLEGMVVDDYECDGCIRLVALGRRGRRVRCENVTIAANKLVILFTLSGPYGVY